MNPYNLNPNPEALRCLGIAEKLLDARDLVGSKTFATRARESDPGLDEAEQILAIVDTLIAGEKQISNHNLDWYAILQLARQTHDSELIASRYRRLSLLLNPNRNKFAFAEHAFKLVAEAWLVLSNPSRKLQFDNEFGNSGNAHFNFLQQHYETPQPQQQQQNNISTHFNFIQEHSEQLHQSLPMQQQFLPPFPQQLFTQQSLQFMNEQQQQQPLPQQVHWSNQTQQPLFRPQPQQPQLQQHWPQPQPQQQQALLWSQLEPQHQPPPLFRPQPQLYQAQQPFLEPRSQPQSQPEKAPPQSSEQAEKDMQFNQRENRGNGNNGNVDESTSFWTTCPYCYNMYEYPSVYAECTLRCQKCKKAFHAVRLAEPPDVAEGEDAYFCCWGFVPLGVSASYLEEHKVGASSWKPLSTMFGFPQGGNDRKPKNVRNSGPWPYIDDDDMFLDISSNEESDDDWHDISKKKTARSSKRKISTAKKVPQSQVYKGEKVAQSNLGESQSGVVEGVGVSVPNMAVPSVPTAAEPSLPNVEAPSVPNSAVLSVPVGETHKKATGETSTKTVVRPNKKGVAVSTRKQQGKLDLNVEFNNEGEEAAPGTGGANKAGNRVEDNIEGVGFFEGLDEFLSNLPILSVAGDDKVKAV